MMGTASLADLLKDFGRVERGGAAALVDMPVAPAPERGAEARPMPAPAINVEAILAEERRKVESETTERLEHLHQEMMAAEREAHRLALEEAQAHNGEQAAERMMRRLDEMEEKIAAFTSAMTARILASLVGEDIQKRSIEALAEIVRKAIEDDEAVRIRVSAPQFLFASLAAALGERAPHLEHTEADGLDLTVDIDETLFETRFAEWSAALTEILA